MTLPEFSQSYSIKGPSIKGPNSVINTDRFSSPDPIPAPKFEEENVFTAQPDQPHQLQTLAIQFSGGNCEHLSKRRRTDEDDASPIYAPIPVIHVLPLADDTDCRVQDAVRVPFSSSETIIKKEYQGYC
ncbi:MAG: hypothetical protein HN411_01595 [Waddliaceae bacterium]|jgi:hypothetical protein|nr:hypothetical protein [Waddliaceae bacterium]MBT3578484.1 hypothetical protein [Waddliaceae bacterium]MBT4444936.1 hypothetical protein [Waddliaceae bacterium]MBT7263905.1 hypothetical protein [Waddliaceae bacterium]MBT7462266.1 hypothetical protein [Waddliaceae bacterium]